MTLHIKRPWLDSGPKFAEGDLVSLAEDSQPPLRWQMARIQKLYASNDEIKQCRKVKDFNWNYNSTNSKSQKATCRT